ncbi:hypothetical protein LOAG_01390 [Loa loa]|uniref:Uncharacterized protein n=1 Tax=Loa loa TaxID=7209 RepID=A0A1S0UB69_LOALO|nr:hypothetical protein LOAG_01390 [Loa loa]EFO27101.1 hypothetical protein LOAG_01390 [Loa loa]
MGSYRPPPSTSIDVNYAQKLARPKSPIGKAKFIINHEKHKCQFIFRASNKYCTFSSKFGINDYFWDMLNGRLRAGKKGLYKSIIIFLSAHSLRASQFQSPQMQDAHS